MSDRHALCAIRHLGEGIAALLGHRVPLRVRLLWQWVRECRRGHRRKRHFGMIDNYCASHPTDSIAAATIALISELSKGAGQ